MVGGAFGDARPAGVISDTKSPMAKSATSMARTHGAMVHPMSPEEIEGNAECLLKLAGVDLDGPSRPVALAKSLLGPGSVRAVYARALPGDGSFAVVNGHPRIYVRQGLSKARRRWAICHELAEWWMWREDIRDEWVEGYADAIAAGLLVPRAAFQCALREVGDEYHRLAEWFGTTESCTALRLGEVTGEPLALIAPRVVRVRGEEFGWPPEHELRALTKKPRVPGIRKARLRDNRRRVAMRATG